MKTTTTNNGKKLLAVTHYSQFHADDVVSAALISIFLKEEYSEIRFERVNYQTPIADILANENDNNDVIVFDVGRHYDPDNMLFDHHQFRSEEENRASAGMVFDWLVEEGKIGARLEESMRPLIKAVDDHDVGIRQAGNWEFPMLISKLNEEYSAPQEEHYKAFIGAVEFATKIFERELDKTNKEDRALELLHSASTLNVGEECPFRGLYLNEFPEEWYSVIHEDSTFDDVDILVWKDTVSGEYKAQTVSVKDDGFKKKGRRILVDEDRIENDDDIIFVHSGQFFMVAKSKEAIIDYLNDNLVWK